MDDFEYQLAQEAACNKNSSEDNKSNTNQSTNPYEYVDASGTVFEWDHNKKGWFPKVDDDFIARYQANYGVEQQDEEHNKDEEVKEKKNDDQTASTTAQASQPKDSQQKDSQSLSEKRKAEEPTWFEVDDDHNTNVYVSDLPLDTTEDEFVELMKKCGLIMKDDNNQMKIKLYRDSQGNLKGDGRCCYIKVESVDLALNILDGYNFKGKTIKVERAKFSLKGDFDPTKKPKRKKRDKEKMKKKIEKLLDWRPEKLPGERPKHEKVVIIKNMFDLKEFESEPRLILEYKNDVRDECNEKCGEVKKVEIFDLHPEGVVAVTFKEFQHAEQCVSVMNGRWFAGRQLTAHLWDGKTRYKIEETEEEIEKRIQKWDQFLEGESKE